jgi:hypothetical protein
MNEEPYFVLWKHLGASVHTFRVWKRDAFDMFGKDPQHLVVCKGNDYHELTELANNLNLQLGEHHAN